MYPSNTKIRIGIIRGGKGDNFEFSLKEGGDLISFINNNLSNKYQAVDIFIDRENIPHINGLPVNLNDVFHKSDVIWNTYTNFSHILDSFSIKHISNSAFSNVMSNNRSMLEEHMKSVGVKMPRHFVILAYQYDFDGDINKFAFKKAKEVFEKFGSPWIVHTFGKDMNTAIHIAKTFGQLVYAISEIAQSGKSILVEELITGKVASVHTIPKFRNEEIYAMNSGNLSLDEKQKLLNVAKDLHTDIDAKHYLKSSFVIHPRGHIYLVNVELKPDFKEYSDLHQSCKDRGVKISSIFEHIVDKALK